MRNVKCVSDFLWYVHCEVDLESELYFCGRWPIFMMVVSLAPCSFRDMPPPALKGLEILHVVDLMDVHVVGLMVI